MDLTALSFTAFQCQVDSTKCLILAAVIKKTIRFKMKS